MLFKLFFISISTLCGLKSENFPIDIYEINHGIYITTLSGHNASVNSFAVLQNGMLASSSDDKTIKIWNPVTAELLNTLTNHSDVVNGLAVLENGNLASCSGDTTIKIWDLSNGNVIRTLEGHSNPVNVLVG